ncbi:MAG: hypothetical protein KDC57_17690 [Saprospiraceae bacterium]|nr:hypothetical protein [Saprospiraceae bacterium]
MSYTLAIVDSGSTKGDWVLWGPGSGESQFSTMGFNPYLVDFDVYRENILAQHAVAGSLQTLRSIYFFAAGIGNEEKRNSTAEFLQTLFPHATLFVDSDLKAAAWACAGNEPAIIGILGTGSNACVYDGREIIEQTTSLGWILGDEGSGSYLGKELLRQYIYGNLPVDLQQSFKDRYRLDLAGILKLLYHTERPNMQIARYAEFIHQYRTHPMMQQMLANSFKDFARNHLEKFSQFRSLPIHLIGSIAFHFEKELRGALEEFNVKPFRIIQKPIHQLKEFIIANKYDNG